MSVKRRRHNVTEREGVNYVRSLVEEHNCVFHEIHKENDVGVDGIIELFENEEAKGICIAVQIKSGSSYSSKTGCAIQTDKAHFEYWLNHSLPVLAIVYDPTEKCAFWTSITGHLEVNRDAVREGPYSISIPKNELHRFDAEYFAKVFLPIFLKKRIILDFDQSKQWAYNEDYDKHSIGVGSLLYGHRLTPITWDMYIDIFRTRPQDNTNPSLIYCLALAPGHPDIFWGSHNILSPDIEKHALQLISQFSRKDILKLVSFIDELGVDRGSVGQNVAAVLTVIPDYRQVLEDIALDQNVDFDTRYWVLALSVEYWPSFARKLLRKLLDSDQQMSDLARQIAREGW